MPCMLSCCLRPWASEWGLAERISESYFTSYRVVRQRRLGELGRNEYALALQIEQRATDRPVCVCVPSSFLPPRSMFTDDHVCLRP